MIEVAVEFVEAILAEFADFWVKKDAVGVRTHGEKFADRRVWSAADRLVILNGNDRRS